MILFSFVLQYYVMSYITTNDLKNITNSLGKIYISSIMAIIMGIFEVGMNDMMIQKITWNYYIILGLILLILVFSYRNQYAITDKEYLKEMIEHHSMAILTSKEILKKTHNNDVKMLASNIVNTQNNEINYMNNLLDK